MSFLLSLFIFLFGWSVSAKIIGGYNYPYQNPYLASLTYEVIQSRGKYIPQVYHIPGMESRSAIRLLEKRNYTRVNVYKQKKPSPLAFMIPGTGADCTDPGVNSHAQLLYELGYHVIVLSSPWQWRFVLSENLTGIPGYTPFEARDLYAYMQKVMAQLTIEDPSFEAKKYVLLGYSLGGGEAAFISEIDRAQKKFNFQKILLVNPPFDLLHATNTLDHLLYVAAKWTPNQIDRVQSLVYTYGPQLLARNYSDPTYFYGFDQTPFSRSAYAQFLIGASFRSTLGDDIFVSQQIQDVGLLKVPASHGHQSLREEEARSISFAEFAQKLVVPSVASELGIAPDAKTIFKLASVNYIRKNLIKNPNLFIFHNADDFLVSRSDLVTYEKALGERMTVFPRGGHLGNMWFPTNRQALISLFEQTN